MKNDWRPNMKNIRPPLEPTAERFLELTPQCLPRDRIVDLIWLALVTAGAGLVVITIVFAWQAVVR